jgi:hypothetical protein
MKTCVTKCEAKSVETKLTKVSKKKKKQLKKRGKQLQQQKRRHIEENFVGSNVNQNSVPSGNFPGNIWQNAYINAVKWQCQQQVRFWKNIAMKYKEENDQLRRQLKDNTHAEQTSSKNKDTSSDDEVNEQFISFLEISAKHRMERYSQKIQEEESD